MKALKDRKWICRMWTESNGNWTSKREKFDTMRQAKECGIKFLHHLDQRTETAREYEIYMEGEF